MPRGIRQLPLVIGERVGVQEAQPRSRSRLLLNDTSRSSVAAAEDGSTFVKYGKLHPLARRVRLYDL